MTLRIVVIATLISCLFGCAKPAAPPSSPVFLERPSAPAFPAGVKNPMQTALDALGLTRATLRFNPAYFDMNGGDKYLSRSFALYETQPLEIPYLLGSAIPGATEKPRSIHRSMQAMLSKVDARVRRGLAGTKPLQRIDDILASSSTPLADSVRDVCIVGGRPLSAQDLENLKEEAAKIPADIQNAAAYVLWTSIEANEWHRKAFARSRALLTDEFQRQFEGYIVKGSDGRLPENVEEAIDQTDFLSLYAGAEDLALAVDRATKRLGGRKTSETLNFDWLTPRGRVIIRAGNNAGIVYPPEMPILLSFDMDGDDTYRAGGANLSIDRPISILIDFGGNDRYEGSEQGGLQFGAGTFGYGFLVDMAGNDTYKGGALAFGSGLFGFGVLQDMGGNDTYSAIAHSEGAGSFGIGLLIDLDGSDSYSAYTFSQGFGFTKGCGHLLDLGKNDDRYVLRNDKILFPAAQSPKEHNSSCGQGFGQGLREDLGGGHSWAGGSGLLLDEGGNDTYKAEIFAQGAGYWYGVGVLVDGGGDDSYSGYWYCQGAGAHFAVGCLADYGGNDRYSCSAQVSMGGAHDWSVAWLLDTAGNDTYDAGDLSLGSSNMNGIGIFLDLMGNDRYTVKPDGARSGGAARITSSGWGTARESQMNAGIFLDCAGRDTYSGTAGRNNSVWRGKKDYPKLNIEGELGVGVDTETSGVSPVRLTPYTKRVPEED